MLATRRKKLKYQTAPQMKCILSKYIKLFDLTYRWTSRAKLLVYVSVIQANYLSYSTGLQLQDYAWHVSGKIDIAEMDI